MASLSYSLKVEEGNREAIAAGELSNEARKLLSVSHHESFEDLYKSLDKYAEIWATQLPTAAYFEAKIAAAFDEDLGFSEIAFTVDRGLFSDNVHVLTILATD
jgi:hypothetical protein